MSERERERERERGRERESERERERQREREREREIDRDREIDRGRDREGERRFRYMYKYQINFHLSFNSISFSHPRILNSFLPFLRVRVYSSSSVRPNHLLSVSVRLVALRKVQKKNLHSNCSIILKNKKLKANN